MGWLLLGTLLPDLVDKPLYYLLAWSTGRWSHEIGLVSGTRTFGHTFLFFGILLVAGWGRRAMISLAVGVGTHLLFDRLFEAFSGGVDWAGFLFPFLGLDFADAPFKTGQEHFWKLLKPENLISEALGLFFLVELYRKRQLRVKTSPD